MSLDKRHTEKNILFDLLRAQALNPALAEFREFGDVVYQLIATMEPEDVELVEKRVAEYIQKYQPNN